MLKTKHYLLIQKTTPFADYSAQEGIELAMALASFEQQVTLLFMADGCWQLVKTNSNHSSYRKDFLSNLKALRLTGITNVYINTQDCNQRNIDVPTLIIPVTAINPQQQQELINTVDVVLTVG